PRGDTRVEPGDVLIVEGKIPDIARIEEEEHLTIAGTQPEFPDPAQSGEQGKEARLAVVIVPPRSMVAGRTLQDVNFRNRHGMPVLGIQRHGEPLRDRMRDIVLEPGDALLVSGRNEEL